jgi:hypothetical protein
MPWSVSPKAQAIRPAAMRETDIAAIRAIAQAAVDVELFTIPLYMTSLYSIQGMHPIVGRNSQLYAGRLWPGAKTMSNPGTPNEEAFNTVFSVFIQEMLHLQLAANMATALGHTPTFTSGSLQTKEHGWSCYGPDVTIIPNIVDLRDTVYYDPTDPKYLEVRVDVGPLDAERVQLFLIIEQPEEQARASIIKGKYFPQAPFDDWKEGDPLPMFGTIGCMYQCYLDYLYLRYDDDKSLWDVAFNPGAQQNDLFNSFSSGHPMREFMGFETTIATTDPAIAFPQMRAMMNAITDQGEGHVLKPPVELLTAVDIDYRPRDVALRADYPSYDDEGKLTPSADATARVGNDALDHYERFGRVQTLVQSGAVATWDQRTPGTWKPEELVSRDVVNPYKLPSPEDVAGAMNQLAGMADTHETLSKAVVGAIYGVTRVLDEFWKSGGQFPFPAMGGTGDRMSIIWAVTGKTPNLAVGIGDPTPGALYHACQALDLEQKGQNDCAQVEVYHTCISSNLCRGQGGCGFVNKVTGGGSCGGGGGGGGGGGCGAQVGVQGPGAAGGLCGGVKPSGPHNLCGGPPAPPSPPPPICGAPKPHYSAPGDNKCGGLGGCAVPISESQLYPIPPSGQRVAKMDVFKFVKDAQGNWTSEPAGTITYQQGDRVIDKAYEAYAKANGVDVSDIAAKKPSLIRLAFPPST